MWSRPASGHLEASAAQKRKQSRDAAATVQHERFGVRSFADDRDAGVLHHGRLRQVSDRHDRLAVRGAGLGALTTSRGRWLGSVL
jgi:hypothetical protein